MNNPYIDETDADLPLVAGSEGCVIRDTDGKSYIDACSGAITANLGHGHPKILEAMQNQFKEISFAYRTQFNTRAKSELAERLVHLTENKLNKVYFVGSGSEAVESSIKVALQHFYAKGETGRSAFVSLSPSYHGSTLGALGLTSYRPLEEPFQTATVKALKIPSPNYYRKTEADNAEHDRVLLEKSRQMIEEFGKDRIAGIVLEPLGGASTGVRVASSEYLRGIREICDEIGALLIMDEVLTGVGRTGSWFCWQKLGVAPDIMALGKGLGAGYYPIAAMLCNNMVFEPILSAGPFMHGHTYAGNPMGCAVANCILNIIESEDILNNVEKRGKELFEGLVELKQEFPFIGDVRGYGLLYGVEFVQSKETAEPFPAKLNFFTKITDIAKSEGLLIYPRRCLDGVLGDHVLICPPLNINANSVKEILFKLNKTFKRALSIGQT